LGLPVDNDPMSYVRLLLWAIDVVLVLCLEFGRCPCPLFISKGAGVIRKELGSVIIVVQVQLYL
jgi:hypothetical protein